MSKPLAWGLGLWAVVLLHMLIQQGSTATPLLTVAIIALLCFALVKIWALYRKTTHTNDGKETSPIKRGIGIALGLIFLLAFLRVSQKSRTANEGQNAGQTTGQEYAWIEKGKAAVREKMKDPDATQFRNVFFHRGTDDIPLTCGEVNGKNSFGAYNGFQRFVSAGKSDLTYLEEQIEDFSVLWDRMCQ